MHEPACVCLRAPADMHGMVPPEFAHWLKHTDAGRAAKTQPGEDNVIFKAAPGAEALSLRPPLASGGDSSAVPVGSVVKASNDKGWSWYDVMVSMLTGMCVCTHLTLEHATANQLESMSKLANKSCSCPYLSLQAKVSVSEAYSQLNALSDQHLLFVDHPVMITHNAKDAAADADWTKRDESMTEPGRVQALRLHQHKGSADLVPDEALSAVNYHIRHGHCKANWVSQQRHANTNELLPMPALSLCFLMPALQAIYLCAHLYTTSD